MSFAMRVDDTRSTLRFGQAIHAAVFLIDPIVDEADAVFVLHGEIRLMRLGDRRGIDLARSKLVDIDEVGRR